MKKILMAGAIALMAMPALARVKHVVEDPRPAPLPAPWVMLGHVDQDRLEKWRQWLENHPKSAYALCVHMNEANGHVRQVCKRNR